MAAEHPWSGDRRATRRETTTLFEVPGTPPLIELSVSRDQTSLAVVANPGLFERKRKRPAPFWQVWKLDVDA